MAGGGLAALLRRLLLRLAARPAADADPWERIDLAPRLVHYGAGAARHDVSWYFEGPSTVAVASLDEVRQWLAGCRYATDSELFQEPDFWQHPRTFELMRCGDCEDFALWAWRKLVELGYDADLVVGRCRGEGEEEGRHAWVVFRRDGAEYLFEPVSGAHPHAVRPLVEVRERYVPEFGLAADRRRFTYAGHARYRGDRREGARLAAPPTAPPRAVTPR